MLSQDYPPNSSSFNVKESSVQFENSPTATAFSEGLLNPLRNDIQPSLLSVYSKSPLSLSKVYSTETTEVGTTENDYSNGRAKKAAHSQPRISNLLTTESGPMKMDWMSYRKL